MDLSGSVRRILDTYVVTRFANLPRGLQLPDGHDLVLGQGVWIGGALRATGDVHLGHSSRVRGGVAGMDVVVGAYAHVQGHVHARGNVHVLQGAHVHGRVQAAGDVTVVGGTVHGDVSAAGDVSVRAPALVRGEIHAGGRVRSLEPPTDDAEDLPIESRIPRSAHVPEPL